MTFNVNQLTSQQKQCFLKGVHLFNHGEFWESHEAWEDVWRELEGQRKIFVQGLIQAAASFVHWNKGNPSSCRTLALKALDKLSPLYPNQSVNLGKLMKQLEWMARYGKLPDGDHPCQIIISP